MTTKQINKALAIATGHPIAIEKCEGFYYFVSDDLRTSLWLMLAEGTCTYFTRLDDVSMERWIEDAQTLIAELPPIAAVTQSMMTEAAELAKSRPTHVR